MKIIEDEKGNITEIKNVDKFIKGLKRNIRKRRGKLINILYKNIGDSMIGGEIAWIKNHIKWHKREQKKLLKIYKVKHVYDLPSRVLDKLIYEYREPAFQKAMEALHLASENDWKYIARGEYNPYIILCYVLYELFELKYHKRKTKIYRRERKK